MTISVGELFDRCELHPAGVVQWGTQVPLDLPGVYVVASTPDLCDAVGLNQYYGTRIGRPPPHAGGWWLKTLAGPETLFVHYAATEVSKPKEALMLRIFADAVPSPVRRALHCRRQIVAGNCR